MTQIQKSSKQKYWRSLSELDNEPEFEEMLHREFPQAAEEFPKGVSRRRWLQLMGASLALGAAGCRFETETIAPFVKRPHNRIPGVPQNYATSIEVAGRSEPLLVSSYDGRPIKIDGSPEHALTKGASSSHAQACILDLYDPDRSRSPMTRDGNSVTERTREEFMTFVSQQMTSFDSNDGLGLCFLAEPSTSPTQNRLRGELLAKYPSAKWFDYSSFRNENATEGSNLAFGKAVRPLYQLENAKVILTIDADPFANHPMSIRNSRGWSEGRDVDHGKCNRLYCVESQFSVTGMSADHRLPLRSDQQLGFLKSLVNEVEARKASDDGGSVTASDTKEQFLQALAQDIVAHGSEFAIFVGQNQPASVHALAMSLMASMIDDSTADEARPVVFIDEPYVPESNGKESLSELVGLIEGNEVESLFILGGNPMFDAPQDSRLQEVLKPESVANIVQLSFYANESTRVASWHMNQAHALESWGDTVLHDGSWGISQPMIEPIFGGMSTIDLLSAMLGQTESNGLAHVRATASQNAFSPGDKSAWQKLVHDGFLEGSAATPVAVEVSDVDASNPDEAWKTNSLSDNSANGSLEVVMLTSGAIHDGRFANNGWLQELPDSVTKVTWGNAALVGPATAESLGLEQNKMVKIEGNGNTVELPVFIQPGQAPGSIGIALGYGRTHVGLVGGDVDESIETVGVDINTLRTMDSPFHCSKVTVTPTSSKYVLGTTQDHNAIDKVGLEEISRRMGELVREGNFDDYEKFLAEHAHDDNHDDENDHEEGDDHSHEHEHHSWPHHHLHFPNVDLNPGPEYTTENKWGMSIDLNKCTGCNACVVACQSENNIPVVGLDQVRRGREMHWLRIDRYFGGEDRENPKVVTQPLTCHHCEKAPCETVCPVAATVHSREGLNDMVYNRCVGTRYCANNCPYKVRRFNYLNYTEAVTFIKYPWADKLSEANKELRGLVMNPEVTVRSRGVMEKCTYCVQRIQNTKIQARNEDNREIGPNEVTTACQDACPTQAIVFGDLNNHDSDVHKAHANARSYTMLEELNILPRTKYMARVRNPHPALKPESDHSEEEAGAH